VLVQKLNKLYEKSLVVMLNHRKTIVVFAGILLAVSIFVMSRFGNSFLPDFNEGT
jgi:Cu/Ag efflux pump CusA